jgi:hypothetical protein
VRDQAKIQLEAQIKQIQELEMEISDFKRRLKELSTTQASTSQQLEQAKSQLADKTVELIQAHEQSRRKAEQLETRIAHLQELGEESSGIKQKFNELEQAKLQTTDQLSRLIQSHQILTACFNRSAQDAYEHVRAIPIARIRFLPGADCREIMTITSDCREIHYHQGHRSMSHRTPKPVDPAVFAFKHCFGSGCSTRDITPMIDPLIQLALNGKANTLTFIMDGASGSGKSFTMLGKDDAVLPHTANRVFQWMSSVHGENFSVVLNACEIIQDRQRNCLNEWDTIVASAQHLVTMIKLARASQKTTSNGKNTSSSRRFLNCDITIHHEGRISKLIFADLAGGERSRDVVLFPLAHKDTDSINKRRTAVKTAIHHFRKRQVVSPDPDLVGHFPYQTSQDREAMLTLLYSWSSTS